MLHLQASQTKFWMPRELKQHLSKHNFVVNVTVIMARVSQGLKHQAFRVFSKVSRN